MRKFIICIIILLSLGTIWAQNQDASSLYHQHKITHARLYYVHFAKKWVLDVTAINVKNKKKGNYLFLQKKYYQSYRERSIYRLFRHFKIDPKKATDLYVIKSLHGKKFTSMCRNSKEALQLLNVHLSYGFRHKPCWTQEEMVNKIVKCIMIRENMRWDEITQESANKLIPDARQKKQVETFIKRIQSVLSKKSMGAFTLQIMIPRNRGFYRNWIYCYIQYGRRRICKVFISKNGIKVIR